MSDRSKPKVRWAILLAVLVSLGVLEQWFFTKLMDGQHPPRGRMSTQSSLKQIDTLLNDVGMIGDLKLVTDIEKFPENVVSKKSVSAMFVNWSATLEKVDGFTNGIVYDEWGTPLHVAGRSVLNLESTDKRLLEAHSPICVWSSGPNRANEYGNGDDVFLSK